LAQNNKFSKNEIYLKFELSATNTTSNLSFKAPCITIEFIVISTFHEIFINEIEDAESHKFGFVNHNPFTALFHSE